MLVIKAIKALLPREMGIAQQPLASGDQAVIDLLLTEGIEELARAPTLGLSLLGERLPLAAKAGEFQLLLLCRSLRLEQQRQGCFHRL